jgi:hypothetical protein
VYRVRQRLWWWWGENPAVWFGSGEAGARATEAGGGARAAAADGRTSLLLGEQIPVELGLIGDDEAGPRRHPPCRRSCSGTVAARSRPPPSLLTSRCCFCFGCCSSSGEGGGAAHARVIRLVGWVAGGAGKFLHARNRIGRNF